ncbi:MAG: hypothetical protein M3A44_07350 [Gammaproteobacteria bacterium]
MAAFLQSLLKIQVQALILVVTAIWLAVLPFPAADALQSDIPYMQHMQLRPLANNNLIVEQMLSSVVNGLFAIVGKEAQAADGVSGQEGSADEQEIVELIDRAASDHAAYNILMAKISYNPRVKEKISYLRPDEYKKKKAVWQLAFLASYNNNTALSALIGLANDDGNDRAIAVLRRVGEDKVLLLRQGYLANHNEKELQARFRDNSFKNNPYFLYVSFLSRENFTALAKIIFVELEKQASGQNKDLNTLLHDLDPRGLFYKDFILQSAHFSMLEYVVTTSRSLYEVMDLLFKDLSPKEVNTFALRLALFVEDILRRKEFQYQKEFQEYLMKLHDEATGSNKRLLAALVVVYEDQLTYLNALQFENISKFKKEIGSDVEENISLEEMLDRPLIVHIVFADRDAERDHYQAALGFFKSHGYTFFLNDEDKVMLKKGKILLSLIKGDPERRKGYDINEHLSGIDIVVSRSHSGQESRVFRGQSAPINKKMIFLISSCRSATDIPRYNESYPGAYIIGANSTATGDATNWITYYLLEGITSGIADFRDLEAYLKTNIEKAAPNLQSETNSYVFPADDSQIVQKIVLKYGNESKN